MRCNPLFLSVLTLLLANLSDSIGQPVRISSMRDLGGERASVGGMVEDERGFLWLSTNNKGLFRYDGAEFVNYKVDPLDSNSAPVWGSALATTSSPRATAARSKSTARKAKAPSLL